MIETNPFSQVSKLRLSALGVRLTAESTSARGVVVFVRVSNRQAVV
jgi:hypothetical protein